MRQKFYVVDAQGKVKDVARRYREQYKHYKPDYRLADGKTVGETQKALDALPKTATPKHVAKILGNDSWTKEFCCNCAEYFDDGVVFDNYDHSASVCLDCLKTAVRAASRSKR